MNFENRIAAPSRSSGGKRLSIWSVSYTHLGGYRTLVSLLSDAGFRYGTYLWDPRYKGLDDYVWEHCFQRQLS